MAHPGNPLEKAHPKSAYSSSSISRTTYPIAGILTTVYGIDQLPKTVTDIAVLWLLHPRLQTQDSMAALANRAIEHWRQRPESENKGLLAVTFDQRNHGSREVDKLANEAWRAGNQRHAQDMFSTYQGTATDTSLLITHLPSYLPPSLPLPKTHIALGVSLGAHAAWHTLLHDPRLTTAIIILGTPDFARLMSHRASKSKLAAWSTTSTTSSTVAGSSFFGSASFPPALLTAITASDPAGLLLPSGCRATDLPPLTPPRPTALVPTLSERRVVGARLGRVLRGKTVLNMSGGADKLVPYSSGAAFVTFLKGAVGERGDGGGWWRPREGELGVYFEDRVYAGVGHEMTAGMAGEAVGFLGDVLAGKVGPGREGSKL